MLTHDLFGVEIIENEKGFLSVSGLLNSYDLMKKKYGWNDRRIDSVMQSENFKKIIFDIIKFNDTNIEFGNFVISAHELGIVKLLKKLGYWKTTGARNTKLTMCDKKIWKCIYIHLFQEFTDLNMPNWIREIEIDTYKYNIKRFESREQYFIDNFLKEINFFLDTVPIRQYKIDNYRYDLFIEIFGKRILIEYNEKQHSTNSQIEIDYKKSLLANECEYYLIYVPINKEYCIKESIFDIIKGHETLDENLELLTCRFFEMNEKLQGILTNSFPHINYKVFVEAINKKVFGTHVAGMRNLATANELKKITKLEQFITNSIEIGMITNDNQIMNAIQKINI